MQALAEMWGRSGQDFAAAQQGMFSDMARRMAEAPGQQAGSAPAGFFQPQELASANEAFATLWKSALEVSQSITRTMDQGKKPDPLVAELMSKLFDPHAWFSSLGGMDEALQRMAEGPRLADLWDTERKLFNVFNSWTALRRRSIEHNTVMLEAWMRAAGAFAKTLNYKADRRETLGSWREVLALWVETANSALLETQRSEKYLHSQREILKASVAAILRGDTFSEADVQGARAWLAEAGRNPAFLKALMEGEPTVVHQFTARNAIIAGGVKEE
jgi:polyhydroxyalkanoate synthase subunit PhaE